VISPVGIGANRLAESITRMSAGRLEVKVYAAGELMPPSETFDAVSSGAADMYHAMEYYFQHRSRALNFFASVPFGMTAGEMAAWVYHGGGQELWDEVSAVFNIKPFQVGNTGAQMGGWYNREIKAIEDFKGLKIRIPGLGGEVMARIGAKPVAMSGGQIFRRCNPGHWTPPNGRAPGATWNWDFTRSPGIIIIQAFMNRARRCPLASTLSCGTVSTAS